MDAIVSKVKKFLKEYRMFPGDIDVAGLCDVFESEMAKGLASYGSDSTLMMIPTYIAIEENIPANEPIIAIDAGGTNFRTAMVRFDGAMNCVIDDFSNYPMPGSHGEISKEEFFSTIYGYVEPLLDKSDRIGLCFSYPTEIQPNRDGRVISMSKEIKVAGLVGELINENLLNVMRERRGASAPAKSIVQLNDAVATLLGGKASFPNRAFESYIGMILGTGSNTCYIEDVANIGKLRAPAGAGERGNMLINIESGSFGKAPRGPIDDSLDRRTKDRGQYLFEKAISGAYQGPLLVEIVRQAAADGLFGGAAEAAEKLAGVERLTSKEIDDFLFYPFGDNALAVCCRGDGDAALTLYWLIDAMFERIAIFAAANISAVLKKTGKGKNPVMPVCVTADGTTFYKSKLLRPKLDYHIRSFTNGRLGLHCEFVKATNGVLAGAAIAALQNG
jgi:hexokinase